MQSDESSHALLNQNNYQLIKVPVSFSTSKAKRSALTFDAPHPSISNLRPCQLYPTTIVELIHDLISCLILLVCVAMHVTTVPSQLPWVTSSDWETYKDTIKDLYLDKGNTLRDVMATMERDHDFRAT